jgi:hypothetical protein
VQQVFQRIRKASRHYCPNLPTNLLLLCFHRPSQHQSRHDSRFIQANAHHDQRTMTPSPLHQFINLLARRIEPMLVCLSSLAAKGLRLVCVIIALTPFTVLSMTRMTFLTTLDREQKALEQSVTIVADSRHLSSIAALPSTALTRLGQGNWGPTEGRRNPVELVLAY